MDPNIASDKIVIRVSPELKAKIIANAGESGISMNEYLTSILDDVPELSTPGIVRHQIWKGSSSYQASNSSDIYRVTTEIISSHDISICSNDSFTKVDNAEIQISVELTLLSNQFGESRVFETSKSFLQGTEKETDNAFFDAIRLVADYIIDEMKNDDMLYPQDEDKVRFAIKLSAIDASNHMRPVLE